MEKENYVIIGLEEYQELKKTKENFDSIIKKIKKEHDQRVYDMCYGNSNLKHKNTACAIEVIYSYIYRLENSSSLPEYTIRQQSLRDILNYLICILNKDDVEYILKSMIEFKISDIIDSLPFFTSKKKKKLIIEKLNELGRITSYE